MSWFFNTTFYDSVCLKGPPLIQVLASECDDTEHCDIIKLHIRGTWRHQWRHQSTRHKHFPIGSLLDKNPQIA